MQKKRKLIAYDIFELRLEHFALSAFVELPDEAQVN